MQKSPLGRSTLMVSRYCLGSMTWGGPTPMEVAHSKIDMALDHGINFVDTSEIYPVAPAKAETVGRTERIIGLYFESHGRRGDIVLATKQSGIGHRMVRGGAPITPATIRTGIEGCLRRLKTDYIDLYQFHWPNRGSYHDRRNWLYDPSGTNPVEVRQNMADCLGALQEEVRRGTIRQFGLSNETAWGLMQWRALARDGAGPMPHTIQNEYSLLCRHFDTDLAEVAACEGAGLLAYAPFAAGLLTGKYQGRKRVRGARSELAPDLGRRRTERAAAAVDDYLDIAFKHDLDIIGLALAFVESRPFTNAVVFGATTMAQLERILSQTGLALDDEVLTDIRTVHRAHPMPF
ncbi:MAG: aldo/keto reductase [Pseudooceanicola sp.]